MLNFHVNRFADSFILITDMWTLLMGLNQSDISWKPLHKLSVLTRLFAKRNLPVRQKAVPDLIVPHAVRVQSTLRQVPEDQFPGQCPVGYGPR